MTNHLVIHHILYFRAFQSLLRITEGQRSSGEVSSQVSGRENSESLSDWFIHVRVRSKHATRFK